VAAGRGESGHLYILADRTSRGTPAEWAQVAVSLRKELGAQKIVAEANQGGTLITEILRHADPSCEIELIHAGESKKLRAEPIAALAERGFIHHCGEFLDLCDQLLTWVPGSDSPDRLDAMVHACAALTKNAPGRGPTVASSGSEFGIDDEKMWSSL
jgi:phage terminase large subunit-like protein